MHVGQFAKNTRRVNISDKVPEKNRFLKAKQYGRSMRRQRTLRWENSL